MAPLHAAQPPYNLFERAIEEDVLPYCHARNIAVLAYGSLCRGLLSGGMSRRRASPAMICARAIRNFANPASSNISPRSSGWTNSHRSASAGG